MAAASALLQTLEAGDELVASSNIYGGSWRLFHGPVQRAGVVVRWVDLGDLSALKAAITERTKLVWAETPSNPLLHLIDLKAVSRALPKGRVKLVVDNTFLTPLGQSPLECGADYVLHSTTKYLNGHSDGIGGCVVSKSEADDLELGEIQKTVGAILSPSESYSVIRGIKTLALRMERHDSNALRVATYLSKHSAVLEVFYPGLPSHPDYKLARRQMRLSGGVVSFRLAGLAQVKRFFSRLRWFTLAESLGGVESLANHPATMTHASMSVAERRERGITPGLVRLSVGVEAIEDLLEDLESALKARYSPSRS
jgi:cystathionine beta-lyase/cystathionine gamma-synthase